MEVLFQKIRECFGKPLVDYLDRKCWRVHVYGWHMHLPSGAISPFFADGESVREAAKLLLLSAQKYIIAKKDYCDSACPYY